jgi:hypothetical protein
MLTRLSVKAAAGMGIVGFARRLKRSPGAS